MDNLTSKGGTIFEVNRPSFRSGTIHTKASKVDNFVNYRKGLGNYEISRRNFEAPAIKPRLAGEFDKLQAIDIETQGAKVQLSDKTIEELFKTKIGDKTDTKWLEERNRLVADYRARGMTEEEINKEIEINKPLGREQRMITSKQNIGQSSMAINDKLQEIKQEVEEGRGENRAQQALLIGQLSLIFRDTQAISNFTQNELRDLSITLSRLNLPRTYQQMGLRYRYIDIDYYKLNLGIINLYLFGNAAYDPNFTNIPNSSYTNISYNTPVYNFVSSPTGFPTLRINTVVGYMTGSVSDKSQPRMKCFLDLETRGIINYNQMNNIQGGLLNGWDNPEISINVANRIP